MDVHADRDVCIGAGLCVVTAPAVFDQDDDGLVTVLATDASSHAEAVRRAVAHCPSGALQIRVDPNTSQDGDADV